MSTVTKPMTRQSNRIRARESGLRRVHGLTGLVAIALGVVFAARPDIGAVTIAEVYGLFSLVSGISMLVIAANLRKAGQTVEGTHSLSETSHP